MYKNNISQLLSFEEMCILLIKRQSCQGSADTNEYSYYNDMRRKVFLCSEIVVVGTVAL